MEAKKTTNRSFTNWGAWAFRGPLDELRAIAAAYPYAPIRQLVDVARARGVEAPVDPGTPGEWVLRLVSQACRLAEESEVLNSLHRDQADILAAANGAEPVRLHLNGTPPELVRLAHADEDANMLRLHRQAQREHHSAAAWAEVEAAEPQTVEHLEALIGDTLASMEARAEQTAAATA